MKPHTNTNYIPKCLSGDLPMILSNLYKPEYPSLNYSDCLKKLQRAAVVKERMHMLFQIMNDNLEVTPECGLSICCEYPFVAASPRRSSYVFMLQ